MFSKTIVFLVIMCLIVSFCHGKNVPEEMHHITISSDEANGFLHSSDPNNVGINLTRREIGSNCVPCKLNMNPCCPPNICIKKTFWFDECMEVKQTEAAKRL
ncbi:hypothetical protein I4U23_019782 [Adineta vaga]|nr:hypothetical protein I4U23_019782 [Adineta vaga]